MQGCRAGAGQLNQTRLPDAPSEQQQCPCLAQSQRGRSQRKAGRAAACPDTWVRSHCSLEVVPLGPLSHPVPVAAPTSTAVPGGVRLCCWWQGSSPGAGAATAAQTRRRQRSCRPGSPPEGTGTFRAEPSVRPHGGASLSKLCPEEQPPTLWASSLSISNLSFHCSPWWHRWPQGLCTIPCSLCSVQHPLPLLLTS